MIRKAAAIAVNMCWLTQSGLTKPASKINEIQAVNIKIMENKWQKVRMEPIFQTLDQQKN